MGLIALFERNHMAGPQLRRYFRLASREKAVAAKKISGACPRWF